MKNSMASEAEFGHQPERRPDSQEIGLGVFCVRCGYDLRGLIASGHCPECGTDISPSVYGRFLDYSNPHWLKTLFRGQVFLSLMAVFGWLELLIVVTDFLTPLTRFGVPEARTWALQVMGLRIMTVALALGAFLIAAPEPGQSGCERWLSLRRIIRSLALFALLTGGVVAMVDSEALSHVVNWRVRLASWRVSIFAYPLLLVWLASSVSLYLGQIAERLPDLHLRTSSRLAGWAIAFLGTELLVAFYVGALWPDSLVGRCIGEFAPAQFILLLAFLGYLAAFFRHMGRYRRILKQCWKVADLVEAVARSRTDVQPEQR